MPCETQVLGCFDADPHSCMPVARTQPHLAPCLPVVTHMLSHSSQLSSPQFCTLRNLFFVHCHSPGEECGGVFPAAPGPGLSCTDTCILAATLPRPPRGPRFAGVLKGNTFSEVSVTPNLVHVASRPVWPSVSLKVRSSNRSLRAGFVACLSSLTDLHWK